MRNQQKMTTKHHAKIPNAHSHCNKNENPQKLNAIQLCVNFSDDSRANSAQGGMQDIQPSADQKCPEHHRNSRKLHAAPTLNGMIPLQFKLIVEDLKGGSRQTTADTRNQK